VLRRGILTVAALLALVVIGSMALRTTDEVCTSEPAQAPARTETRSLQAAADETLRSPVSSAEPATELPSSAASAESVEPLPNGTVHGLLADYNGDSIPKAGMLFVRSDADLGNGTKVHARADETGYYETTIPPGDWNAYFAGTLSGEQTNLLLVGTVKIVSGAWTRLDYFLKSDRLLTGRFTASPADLQQLGVLKGNALELEIEIRKRGNDRLVAHSTIIWANVPARDWDPTKQDALVVNPDAFQIAGLQPDEYDLRIVLPGEVDDPRTGKPKRLALTRTADLTLASAELPTEELRLSQFITATLAQ